MKDFDRFYKVEGYEGIAIIYHRPLNQSRYINSVTPALSLLFPLSTVLMGLKLINDCTNQAQLKVVKFHIHPQ